MKNFLLFNQFFGTVDSPNQTGETLTPREEQWLRIPLLYPCYTLARVWKYVACMLLALVLGVGEMWGGTSTYDVATLYTANSWSTGTSGTTGSSLNQTISYISYAFTNGSSNKTYVYNSTPKTIQFYSDGNTMSMSTTSSYKITAVSIVVATGSNSPRWNDVTDGTNTISGAWKKGSSAFTPSSTNISADTYTFTPSSPTAGNSLIFSIFKSGGGTGAYLRINSFTVTYEAVGGSGSSTTYDVTYNANSGGTGTTAAQTDNADASQVTTQANGFTPNSGKKFKWWNTKADGSGEDFYPGEKVTINGADVELFAQWETVASNEEFWVGSPTTWTSSKFSVGDMDVKTNSTSKATFITDLTSSDSKVNGSDKHANVILVQDNDNYIQISFSDGSTINDLRLGITTTETSNKNAAVVYSTTEDFSTGEYETKTVSVPANNASAKSLTNFSPATSNKFKYVRIYRKVNTSVYSFTGGSGKNLRIYAIKAQKGSSCTAPNHVDVTGRWDRFAGETISLTATAYSSAGTGSPIAAGSITGYQWQKLVGSTWTDVSNGTESGAVTTGATTANLQIANCKATNSGKYRCVVSTGATCSTASATATDGTQGLGVKVFMLECYNDGTKTCSFTRTGDTQTGTATLTLAANTAYTFKFHVDNVYYGNNASINEDITNYVFCNSDNGGNCASNFTINSGLGGTFTLGIDYSTGGNSNVEGEPELSVTYPRKRIYLSPGVWKTPSDGEKFAYRYFRDGGSGGWTDFLTPDDCGMYADIPQWNGVKIIPCRLQNTTVSPGSWDDRWNQTNDITVNSNDYVTITGWNASDFTYTAYSTPTYTISYNAGTGGSGTKASESKTCGVDFTLPGSTFTYAGHTQDGWATTDGGTIAYALSGSYTTNDDEEFFPHWKCNTPTITDNGDNTVAITVPSGTTVRYTTDGSAPTSSTGTVYSNAIDIAANVTIKAIAYQSNCTDSEVASQACTYHAPAATPILSWALATNSASWTATPTNNDETNLTDVATSTEHAAIQTGATSGKTCKISLSSSATPDKYVTFTFKVACGKKLTPSSVWMEVANVGGSSDGKMTHKAELSDIYGHTISATVVPASDGVLNELNITNGGGTYFQGEVTLKVWAWNSTSGGDGSAFRMGPNVKIFGEIANQASPAATITWNTQPANGQVGDPDFAYDVTCSDGSAVTVTSANTTYATIVGGKLHYAAVGTTHLVATATDACGNVVVQNSDNFTVSAAAPAGDCITITNFETSQHNNSSNKPDSQGKYIYGYKTTVDAEHAVTITTANTNNKGQNSNADMLVQYGTSIYIYADNTTTGGTPATFSNVTSVSLKVKNKHATKYSTLTVKVGSTTIANAVALSDANNSTYTTYTYDNLAQLSGKIEIHNGGSGSTDFNFFIDDIEICTSSLDACTTPALPDLSNKTVCEGEDADAAWNATITNSGSLVSGETVAYLWVKKGGSTPVSSVATYQPTSVTEAMAGTYVVTATVSADSKASSTATKEVTLTVNEATEVTAITADKATVYPTNSVTLTATANMDATWQWYTCTSAEGAGEAIISGATSASYTIASAPAAGTHYYKVEATGSCGTDEMVYTLTVSAAAGGDCFHYVSVLPDKDISPSSGASIVTPTHATTLEGGTMKVGSQQITITKNGLKLESSKSVSITLDNALEAGNVVIVKGTAATAGYGVTINGVNFYESGSKTFDVSYTVAAGDGLVGKTALTVTKYSGSSYLQEIKITGCGTACTDPEVTASVNNSTACVGTSVTFTATGAHASATYQWQKLDGTWTNISGATASTYNIPSVVAGDAGKYRVIASHNCNRTSNEVTLSVPVAPVFDSFSATRTVMATQALSITDVEASDATSYAWYKSADATYDAGSDTRVGTAQELLLAAGGEAAGATYYLFCVASNACGSTTSSAITVNVTAFIEEDCATRGTEGAAEFGFQNSGCSQSTYNSTAVWSTGTSNSKILIYSAPDGKYFKTMKVTIASSSASQASYNWSTDGGSSYTADGVAITGVTTTLTEKTINLSAHGNVNEVKIGRNFGNGESSGTLYVSKICFEYTDACTATTVTPSASSKTHTIGESFTKPTFTLGPAAVSSGTLTYSSSDEEIASVDESGNVTFNGTAGTVTITAAYAGGEVGLTDYCASEGSYTITVTCPGGAPKIVADGSVNMSGCNSSVILNAKTQAGADFAGGSYQWFRNGEEIEGATSSSYTAKQAGVYTVAYTSAGGCTSLSTNSATVTSESAEPEITKLVPFQYYHVDKAYTAQMKDRHLFSVKGSAAYGSTGKNFKLTMSRNGEAETDITTEASIWVESSDDGQVDNVMIDLNKLSGKYNEGDELVLTCAAVDCSGKVSTVYKDEITIHVIGATPTLALICSGTDIAAGTRDTKKLTVGGDFLTGYNKADLCQQTGNTSFDANIEWGLYTELKAHYIVTPVNGYAVFNKLNYEPFDILLLTDYPKASKSDAAATVLDDMADLCDYRPMLSFKAHMVAKSPSKWAAKGFTTSPVVPKNTRTRLNIVCYAHPMFSTLKSTTTHIQKDNDDPTQIVYTMLTGGGYESSKGLQGFELEAAENFVTIGLVHYNATPADATPSAGLVTWTPGSEDRMLVTAVERQENLEARMIMFAVNCGAQSKFTETGRNVVLKCLEYLLDDDPLHVADCSFTFDNGAGNSMNADQQEEACPSCTGTKGDGKWSTAANWGPDYVLRPGKGTEVKIAAPVTVDPAVGAGVATNFTPKVRSVRILEGGQVEIPAGSYLEVVSTIRRQNGNDIYPTEVEDLHIGSSETGNGTLIFNNSTEDTKAQVDMYSKGFIDHTDPEKEPNGVKNYQYIGTPFVEINALYNYYGSWIYSWGTKKNGNLGWVVVKNGGPMTAWTGYCITQEVPTYHQMSGTLTATGTKDIDVPAGQNMVVGNSWTAPIDISKFATTDFENLVGNVYFFNTGVDKTGTAGAAGSRYAGSTYVTVPINSAPYTEDDHIPSLQGFFVKNTSSSEGTLHLDYDKHVRGSSRAGRLSEEMHAPARRAAFSSDEPVVLKMKVSGENYDDKLLLLEREDFTEGFDNGWDGDKWDGNESALYIYTTDNNGTENSVSAIPELEGTIIGFRAGEDDAYTLNFEYLNSDELLYLYDVENNTYTQIMTGMTYRFFTTDNEKHERFIITRSNGQEVATGVEPVSGSLDRSKAKKLLIEDKMFIIVNGMLYDATGKVVK